jgi:hypothetical protein
MPRDKQTCRRLDFKGGEGRITQGQAGILLRILPSLSKNLVPGLVCIIEAIPVFAGAIGQRLISAETILLSSSSLVMQPSRLTLPVPSIMKPPGPHFVKTYLPVKELNKRKSPLRSSLMQTSQTVTLKLQLAVAPPESVAVQLTMVVPSGKLKPDGGEQTTVTPGQLSVTTGWG